MDVQFDVINKGPIPAMNPAVKLTPTCNCRYKWEDQAPSGSQSLASKFVGLPQNMQSPMPFLVSCPGKVDQFVSAVVLKADVRNGDWVPGNNIASWSALSQS